MGHWPRTVRIWKYSFTIALFKQYKFYFLMIPNTIAKKKSNLPMKMRISNCPSLWVRKCRYLYIFFWYFFRYFVVVNYASFWNGSPTKYFCIKVQEYINVFAWKLCIKFLQRLNKQFFLLSIYLKWQWCYWNRVILGMWCVIQFVPAKEIPIICENCTIRQIIIWIIITQHNTTLYAS